MSRESQSSADSMSTVRNVRASTRVAEVEVSEEISPGDELTVTPSRIPSTIEEHMRAFADLSRIYEDSLKRRMTKFNPNEEYFVVSRKWIDLLKIALSAFADKYEKKRGSQRDQSKAWTPAVDILIPVDNADLVDKYLTWGVLVREDTTIRDFNIVSGDTWNALMELVGGGPEIARVAREDKNGRVSIDVCGVTLYIICAYDKSQFRLANFSRLTTLEEVKSEMCRRCEVDAKPEDTRFLEMRSVRHYFSLEALNSAQLEEAEIHRYQVLLLDVRGPDGNWMNPESEDDASIRHVSRRSVDDMSTSTFADEGEEAGLIGLFNLRNTCYMNSTLQCLSNIPHLRNFFVTGAFKTDINEGNPLGTGGKLALAYGILMNQMWNSQSPPRAMSPHKFKAAVDEFKPDFSGFMQHDSQELLSFLLDGLHEDLNRVKVKELTSPVEARGRPDAEVAKEAFEVYQKRNDSRISDLFTGMLMSKVICPRDSCDNVSVTFDPYMMLPLPVDNGPSKTQEVEVVIVPFRKALNRDVVTVTVPRVGPVILLRNQIAKVGSLLPESFFLAEVSQGKIIRLVSDSSNIDTLNPETQIYVLENPDAQKHLDMLHGDFTMFSRPLLKSSDNKLVVDENFLDPIKIQTPPDFIDMKHLVRFTEDPEHETTVVTFHPPVNDEPASPTSPGTRGKTCTCPFSVGQVWVGNFEQRQYPNASHTVRMEVFQVIPDGEGFLIFYLLDLYQVSRAGSEQDTRLLVGHFIPSEVEGQFKSSMSSLRSSNGSKSSSSSDKSREGEKKRSSFNKFSPRNFVPKSLFGRSSKRKNSANGGSSPASASSNSSLKSPDSGSLADHNPAYFEASSESPEEEVPEINTPSSSSQEFDKDGANETSSQKKEYLGRADLDSSPWRIVYGDVTTLRAFRPFKVSGVVDNCGKIFHGKVILDGGFSSVGHFDFFVRLVSEKQLAQADDPMLTNAVDRKIAINDTRAVRFVNKLAVVGKTNPRLQGLDQEFCFDPNILLVDKFFTEGQVYDKLIRFYTDLYNEAIRNVSPTRVRGFDLPPSVTLEEIIDSCKIQRAGKNYALEAQRGEERSGAVIDSSSERVFFQSKHSFLRVVLIWDPESPLVRLYSALQLPPSKRRGAAAMCIYDCLDLFCKEEKLSEMDSWYCNKCQQHQEATKTMQVWSFPPVLILHFKRFSQESDQFTNKLEQLVDFPIEGLDLRKYALDAESGEDSIYDLCAISSHFGGLGSGHYIAYARNENSGRWYEFDDETVRIVENVASIVDNTAYVLFYIRRDLRPEQWDDPAPPLPQPLRA